MNKLDTRLERLEQAGKETGGVLTAIYRSIFSPGDNGPVNEGVSAVTVLKGGGRFVRKDYATDDAFWTAANECHLKIHGKPLGPKERTTA